MLIGAMALATLSFAQYSWDDILYVNPYLANGYFMINPDQWSALEVDHLSVDIFLVDEDQGGKRHYDKVETITINGPTYANVDFGFMDGATDEASGYYHLKGFDQDGKVVLDVNASPRNCVGCDSDWDRYCGQVCNAQSYAWKLQLYSSISLGQSYIKLQDAFIDGSFLYFYVPDGQWEQFKLQYYSGDLGYPFSWDELLDNEENFGNQVFQVSVLPDDARDIEGYFIPSYLHDEGGYAIAKHLGPWRQMMGSATELLASDYGGLCYQGGDFLKNLFNADQGIQTRYAQHDLDPLACLGLLVEGGEGVA